MNYKKLMLDFIQEGKETMYEIYKDGDISNETLLAQNKAFDLIYQILTIRFDNELKQYNNDEEKAFDEFIARKNLDYLRIYIEEFLLLDKDKSEIDFYKTVRKHMRDLLNNLYTQIL